MASSLWKSESRDDRVDKTHRVRVTLTVVCQSFQNSMA